MTKRIGKEVIVEERPEKEIEVRERDTRDDFLTQSCKHPNKAFTKEVKVPKDLIIKRK